MSPSFFFFPTLDQRKISMSVACSQMYNQDKPQRRSAHLHCTPLLRRSHLGRSSAERRDRTHLYTVERVIDSVCHGLESLIRLTRGFCPSRVQLLRTYLRAYVDRIVQMSKLNVECMLIALIYLQRMEGRIVITENNVRELFVACVMLASKFFEEETYSTKDWATISGFMGASELCELEVALLQQLQFDLHVDRKEYFHYMFMERRIYPVHAQEISEVSACV